MRHIRYDARRSPRAWGEAHGEAFREEIQSLAAIRTFLCTRVGAFSSREAVVQAASVHRQVMAAWDPPSLEELEGLARGAALSFEDLVIINHYTDLRDLSPNPGDWRWAPELRAAWGDVVRDRDGQGRGSANAVTDAEPLAPAVAPATDPEGAGGCSTVYAMTAADVLLGQTWDMHATAIPYVAALQVPAHEIGGRLAPAAILLTVTGCVGLAGMNEHRVAVCINNLFSTDATVGAVWPCVVRRMLRERTAADAFAVLRTSPIGSGHHYVVADPEQVFAMETSGERRAVTLTHRREPGADTNSGATTYLHTNHCLAADVAACSKVPPTSTTHGRMAQLQAAVAAEGVAGLDGLWRHLQSKRGWPESVCTNISTPENPHGAATCGAIAMDLLRGEVWYQQGMVAQVAPERWKW